MTAVAVVTPSSGSNSAATPFVEAVGLPWVVGADTGVLLSSSHAAPWPSCAPLCGELSPASIRVDRSSIEALGHWVPRRGTGMPGGHYRGPARGRGGGPPGSCGGGGPGGGGGRGGGGPPRRSAAAPRPRGGGGGGCGGV